MANTPFMSLSLPTPTVTLGPAWATELNDAMERVDQHDHTAGNGRQITVAALNINADLPLGSYNIYGLKSLRMDNQSAALAGLDDIRSIYAVSGDLFYNNGSGTAVQITSGGGLNAASIGGIGGDYATSSGSLFYTSASSLFTFDQSAGVRADIDVAEVTIREAAVSANGVTIKSPASLSAAYNITLPSGLPATTKILTFDATGSVGTSDPVDDSTIEFTTGGQLRVKDSGIVTAKINDSAVTTAKIADANVTKAKLALPNYGYNTNLTNVIVKSASFVNVVTSSSTSLSADRITLITATFQFNGGSSAYSNNLEFKITKNGAVDVSPTFIEVVNESSKTTLTVTAIHINNTAALGASTFNLEAKINLGIAGTASINPSNISVVEI